MSLGGKYKNFTTKPLNELDISQEAILENFYKKITFKLNPLLLLMHTKTKFCRKFFVQRQLSEIALQRSASSRVSSSTTLLQK